MPVHDWDRVEPGIFHHFHGRWIYSLCDRLNKAVLKPPYYALAEQDTRDWEPDVITLERKSSDPFLSVSDGGGTAVLSPPAMKPKVSQTGSDRKRQRRRVVIHHSSDDRVVAALEIVSPGNKHSVKAFGEFLDKCVEFIENDVHLAILDLFRPTRRDPKGIHVAIWEAISSAPTKKGAKPFSMMSYEAGFPVRAFVKDCDVGEALPDLPLFLRKDGCVTLPLESTYLEAYDSLPEPYRQELEA